MATFPLTASSTTASRRRTDVVRTVRDMGTSKRREALRRAVGRRDKKRFEAIFKKLVSSPLAA
jgi:hypothetical protein